MRGVALLLALCGLLAAAHAAEDIAPQLPPVPVSTPLPPSARPVQHDDDDALLGRIDHLIQERDKRISELLKDGAVPNPTAGRTPRIENPDPATLEVLKAHAAARDELRKALESAAGRATRTGQDVLDRGRPRAQAVQTGPLEALNQLAIAECYKDLAGAPDGLMADVTKGQEALTAIDLSMLTETERPRMLYLTLWFQLDALRKLPKDTPAEERRKRLLAAHEAQGELNNQFPGSALAQTAEALFSGLEDK